MKHFILEGKHMVPFEQIAHLEALHHAFLQQGYDNGTFLFSGPQVPAHGGFLVARAEFREQLDALLAEEPFVKAGSMRFVSVTEFDPVQHQPFLEDWFAGVRSGEKGLSAVAEPASCEVPDGLKHFLLEGEHIVPFERRDPALVAAHRAFLGEGYRKGWFLFSGPTIPPNGGFLVARAASQKELEAMLAEEPYLKANVMRFRRVTEFYPAQSAPLLNHWFRKNELMGETRDIA